MKRLLLLFFTLFGILSVSFEQACIVSVDSLQGEYTGDCKKGKADGKGTAKGTDSYTGYFKNGYPDGEGKYVWKNGNWYQGFWKKGRFQGQGTLNKVDGNATDSTIVLKGFWDNGKYMGSYEKPYTVTALTNAINDLSLRKMNSLQSDITIYVKNITGGGSSNSEYALPKTKLVDIQLVEGRYEQIAPDETSSRTANKYILRKVTFPFFAILSFQTHGAAKDQIEKVSLEILENANWYLQVGVDD